MCPTRADNILGEWSLPNTREWHLDMQKAFASPFHMELVLMFELINDLGVLAEEPGYATAAKELQARCIAEWTSWATIKDVHTITCQPLIEDMVILCKNKE